MDIINLYISVNNRFSLSIYSDICFKNSEIVHSIAFLFSSASFKDFSFSFISASIHCLSSSSADSGSPDTSVSGAASSCVDPASGAGVPFPPHAVIVSITDAISTEINFLILSGRLISLSVPAPPF